MTVSSAGEVTEAPPAPRAPRRRLPDPSYPAVAGIVVGLLLAWLHHPRMGLYVVGVVLGVLGVLRLVLPARDAGLLVVRGRTFDVVVLLLLAAGVVLIASVTPFPPPAS
ncbi:MAG TPA: DUF3017 domain-containing protein [Mycobacteriales bacterium]|nr:DUF3017 domain-containing protein [Mycobacteriales bacterium]